MLLLGSQLPRLGRPEVILAQLSDLSDAVVEKDNDHTLGYVVSNL